MEISVRAAMASVEVISIMEEESNIITFNTSVVEEASSPNIVREELARTSVSLKNFSALDGVVPHPDQHPQV
jgi:hypothetical protein